MVAHPLSIQFGERIRELRQASGMSQEAFALHAGIARSYMSRIERGRAEPRFEALSKLAEALEVTPSALFEPPSRTSDAKGAKPRPVILVPFCADGTCFNPSLRQPTTGEFAVGGKGGLVKIKGFMAALDYLKSMDKARWKRPSPNGGTSNVVAHGDWKEIPPEYRKLIE